MGKATTDSQPTDSCRVDWLSLSYYAASEALQQKQLSYFVDVLGHVVKEPTFKDGSGRKFFEHSVFHDAGIALKWSPPDGSRNPGLLSVDLKGSIFKLLSPSERAAIYLDAEELEGFKQCTRLDAQRTILEPQADAEQIHRMVANRQCWIARYSSYSQVGSVDSKGDAVKGASVTWGGRESAARGMTYNKALEDHWPDVRAVRHEVMYRREHARDSFQHLVRLLREEEGPDSKHLAEVRFAQSVLAKQMNYLDTTRLAHLADKREWPENWAKDSEPAPFMREVVDVVPVELQTSWREEKSLEDSHRSMKAQYGRKDALWCLWKIYGCGMTRQEVMDQSFSESISRLQEKDLEEILPLLPEEARGKLFAQFRWWRKTAALNIEGFASEDPEGGISTPAL